MTKKHALTPATWARDQRQIYKWVVPYLGSKPIASIKAPDLLAVLKSAYSAQNEQRFQLIVNAPQKSAAIAADLS